MTHALNELIYGGSYDINNAHYLDQLGTEIRNTADEVRTREPDPAVVRDMARAVDVLMATEAASSFQKLYPVMEAAAATGDPSILEYADSVLNSVYPVGETVDPNIRDVNSRSRREFLMALNRTSRNRSFGHAVAVSEALQDNRIRDDFDRTIAISNWLVKQQRGTITDKEKQELDELLEQRRRDEERVTLEARGIKDGDNFDDAQPYDPFADDETEQETSHRPPIKTAA